MEYTKKFLKYIVIGLLVVIMLASFIIGIAFTLAGICNAIFESNALYLLAILVALLYVFIGFAAMDCINYLADKWSI